MAEQKKHESTTTINPQVELRQTTGFSERYFFVGISIWFLLITFWGFSATFYLNQDLDELAIHLQVHGILFSGWILLFMAQSTLISMNRVRTHMTLGVFGLILIMAMIPGGFYPVLYKVSVGTKTIDHGGFNLTTLCFGYVFVLLGLALRKKPFYHKRFMLFATLIFATAAVDRVAFFLHLEQSQLFRKTLVFIPALLLFAFDYVRTKSVHWFDLLPIVLIMGIYFLSDFFWLSSVGKALMRQLVAFV